MPLLWSLMKLSRIVVYKHPAPTELTIRKNGLNNFPEFPALQRFNHLARTGDDLLLVGEGKHFFGSADFDPARFVDLVVVV